jgi:pilus assembly protein CpaB
MNRTSMIILGGALLFAIVVALIVNMRMSAAPQVAPVVVTGADVLVAAHDLAVGDTLKADNTRWQHYPDEVLYNGLIQKKDQPDEKKLDAYGKPLKRELRTGEPITMQAIVDAQGSYLAAALQPGMRAVAISVRAETTAGGFVSPGDYVDVILNFQVNLRGDEANYADDTVQKYASETILSNVHVMAVDQNAKEDAKEAKVGRTVTLEVDKQGAQILAMASTMGEMSLALRRLGEKDTPEDNTALLTTDVSTSKVIQRIYKSAETSSTKTENNTVRLYSGGAVTNVPVRPSPPPARTGTGN